MLRFILVIVAWDKITLISVLFLPLKAIKAQFSENTLNHQYYSIRKSTLPNYQIIYTYKNEIPSVCLSVRLFVLNGRPEVWSQAHLFGIGTKPNVMGAF